MEKKEKEKKIVEYDVNVTGSIYNDNSTCEPDSDSRYRRPAVTLLLASCTLTTDRPTIHPHTIGCRVHRLYEILRPAVVFICRIVMAAS